MRDHDQQQPNQREAAESRGGAIHLVQPRSWKACLLDLADLQILSSDLEGTLIADTMNLQPDKTLGVGFPLFFVHQIRNLFCH